MATIGRLILPPRRMGTSCGFTRVGDITRRLRSLRTEHRVLVNSRSSSVLGKASPEGTQGFGRFPLLKPIHFARARPVHGCLALLKAFALRRRAVCLGQIPE